MANYILHLENDAKFHAGTKATEDCKTILKKNGYKVITISSDKSKNKLILNAIKLLKHIKLIKMKKNSILVIQHPQYMRTIFLYMIYAVKKVKKCKIICIVHDIESLRQLFIEDAVAYKKMDDLTFKMADILIVHNDRMKEYLVKERGISEKKLVDLGVFDYLVTVPEESFIQNIEKPDDVVIAGNLNRKKSEYVYKTVDMKSKLTFSIYGLNWQRVEKKGKNWNYRGAVAPAELPFVMHGRFGLVWDGNELDTCAGATGEYMRFNNPHKVSLYLVSETPVVIWKEAALAEFIEKERLGITIESIQDLEVRISEISDEEYEAIKSNVRRMSERLKCGNFLLGAIEETQNRGFV